MRPAVRSISLDIDVTPIINERTVVVLGASGFIGSAVTHALAQLPIRLRVVARRKTAVPRDAIAEIEACEVDLTEPGALAHAVADAQVVFPLAAQIRGKTGWRISEDDQLAEQTNVGLIRDLVAAASDSRSSKIVVFPGSNSQVGAVAGGRIDGTEEDRPEGVYDRQKLIAEQLLKDATAAGVLRACSLRLPPVFGVAAATTADDRGVVSTMIRRALSGEPLTIWQDGSVRRDLLYISDAARAFVTAMDHPDALAGQHFVLGTGRTHTLREVFESISNTVAQHTGSKPVPVVTVTSPASADPSDFRSVEVDPSRFISRTGWHATTSMTDGLDRTVGALVSQHLAAPAHGYPKP